MNGGFTRTLISSHNVYYVKSYGFQAITGVSKRLRSMKEFGRLPMMYRALPSLFASVAALLAAGSVHCADADSNARPPAGNGLSAITADRWLDAPAPIRTGASATATDSPTRYRSSGASKSAWIHQAAWLRERLRARDLAIGSPIHIRIFKQSRELELHVLSPDGFVLYRNYPICAVSGTLGPKRFEGDLQAPEGFYSVRAEQLHPHSDFHLAFNLGFPNDFDRRLGRTGSNIMIHGGCASRGCFAMSDYYMEQIYVLAEAALRNGQREIGVEIYPFRMTVANLEAHRNARWAAFWRSMKPAHDRFQETAMPATVEAAEGGYRLAESRLDHPQASASLSAP
jgi:murein L,D-transpeptidase YafK